MMTTPRRRTQRLELLPLDPQAAAALPHNRAAAAELIGAHLSPSWPARDLLDVLPLQAAAGAEQARYGVWAIIERSSRTVIGDIGFFGPPGPEKTVEIGYSIVADRRRHGYATEAATTLIDWALSQPGIEVVIARCEESNHPSVRTLERLGFSRTGLARASFAGDTSESELPDDHGSEVRLWVLRRPRAAVVGRRVARPAADG